VQLKKCEQELQQRKAELEAVHRTQLQAFEERWNSEDYLRKYTKPSATLLNLKAMEKSMVIARMFDQAKSLRRTAISTEKVETFDRQSAAIHEMMLDKARLLERHEREMQTMKTKCQQLFDIQKRQVEQDERPLINQVARFEKMLEDEKNGAAVDPPLMPWSVVTTPRKSTELSSARTAYKFSAYKTSAQNPKLKIQPLGAVMTAAAKPVRTIRVAATGPSRNARGGGD
jgi:hypothetical protein